MTDEDVESCDLEDAGVKSTSAHEGPADRPPDEEKRGLSTIEAELAEEAGAEESVEEEISASPSCAVELPETLMRIVDARINAWRRLGEIQDRRDRIRSLADIREILEEASRQNRQIRKPPAREALEASATRLQQQRQNPELESKPESTPGGREPETNPKKCYAELLDLGVEQTGLLMKRAKLDGAIPAAALPAAESEPLLLLCRTQGLDADGLLGWTYYALGLLQRIAYYRAVEADHQRRVHEAREASKKAGLRVILGRSRETEVPPLDPSVGQILRAGRQELQAIEPHLVGMFWSLYEEIAWLLCRSRAQTAEGQLSDKEAVTARMFLRYGLVSTHSGLIEPETVAFIRTDCEKNIHSWANLPSATNVVYADEYIAGIASRKLTVSPDEDMELNHRNSPEWRADRVWRKAAIGEIRLGLIDKRVQELREELSRHEALALQKEEEFKVLRADGKRNESNAVSQELIRIKAQAVRLSKAIEHVETWVFPKVNDQAVDANLRLNDEVKILNREAVVRREARFVRRAARLVARLKEPFPPFVLRDHFEPARADHHSREAVLAAIRKIEEADRFIFHQVLAPNKHIERRVSVRMSPTFLLPPGRGQMAFSFCERRWDDNGRLVLPLIPLRQGRLADMLLDILSDFHWDCSKEEAGMDWISADALCAGYAAMRWAVRKLPEKSQKLMGIDPRMKDKANWRHHYRLFVNSAKDAGRLLFNQSDDIYRIVVKHVGLPPGLAPLRRD